MRKGQLQHRPLFLPVGFAGFLSIASMTDGKQRTRVRPSGLMNAASSAEAKTSWPAIFTLLPPLMTAGSTLAASSFFVVRTNTMYASAVS